MWFSDLCQAIKDAIRGFRTKKAKPRKPAASFQPQLEGLEDRMLLNGSWWFGELFQHGWHDGHSHHHHHEHLVSFRRDLGWQHDEDV